MDLTTRAQLPPLPKGIRTLTDAQAAALNARRRSTVHSVRNCKTCGGTKTFRWYASTRSTEVVEYDCPCVDQYLMLRWFAHCGIYEAYMRLGWRDLIRVDHEGAEAVVDYVENHEVYRGRGLGLVLSGGRGTGKTLLANLLVKALIAEGVHCYAVTFSELIDEFAEGWRDRDAARWFAQRIRNAEVLLIDDLGRERQQRQKADEEGRTKVSTEVAENVLEAVTRFRIGSNLPTLLTTNLTKDEVHAGYGGHTMSLLTEASSFITVPGLDVRPDIDARTKSEIRLGIKQRPVVVG